MSDTQLITIAIVFVAALGSIMYNNHRITDLRDSLGKRFDDQRDSINQRFEAVNQHIEDKFRLLDAKLDRIIEMLAGHDERLHRLEHPGER